MAREGFVKIYCLWLIRWILCCLVVGVPIYAKADSLDLPVNNPVNNTNDGSVFDSKGGYWSSTGFNVNRNDPGYVNGDQSYIRDYNYRQVEDDAARRMREGRMDGVGTEGEQIARTALSNPDLAPKARGLFTSSDDHPSGRVGLDEKLGEAARLAGTGDSNAQATYWRLYGKMMEFALPSFGGGVPSGTQLQIAADLQKAMNKQIEVSALYRDLANRYRSGAAFVDGNYRQENDAGQSRGAAPINGGTNGGSSPSKDQIKSKMKKEMDEKGYSKMLSDRGVDPNSFLTTLLSGQIDGAADMARALGVNVELNAEELAEGSELAQKVLAENGIQVDGNGGNNFSGEYAGNIDVAGKFKNDPNRRQPLVNRSSNGEGEGSDGMLRRVKKNLIEAAVGFFNGELMVDAKRMVLRRRLSPTEQKDLFDIGVISPRRGDRIFDIARKNYKGFKSKRGVREKVAYFTRPGGRSFFR